MFDMTFVCYLY